MEEWNGLFTKHGLKLDIEKTEVLHIGHQDGSASHRPPEGRAGHRARGEDTDSMGQFRVPRRGSVRKREDGERGTSKSTGRSERMESS